MNDTSVKEANGWADDTPVIPDLTLPESIPAPKDPLQAIQEALREIRDLQKAMLERLQGGPPTIPQGERKAESSPGAAEYEALRHHLEHLRYERDLRPSRPYTDFASWGLWGMVGTLFLGPLLLMLLLNALKF